MSAPPARHDVRLSRLLGRFWTVPNMLSLFRLILVIPVTYLILVDGPRAWLFGLLVVGALTDWFDGRIARWSGTVSEWGKVLDPLADKAAAAMIVMALVVRGSLPAWFLALIVVRDSTIVIGGVVLARRTGHVAMSAWSGKLAVTALALTVLGALLHADPAWLQAGVGATSVLLVLSATQYLSRMLRLLRGEPPEETEFAETSAVEAQAAG